MNEHATDQSVLSHILDLFQQEHRLHGRMNDDGRAGGDERAGH